MTPLLQHQARLDRNTTPANHRVAYASANKVGYFLKILRHLLYFYFQLIYDGGLFVHAFSALTLLVGQQEGHPARKN